MGYGLCSRTPIFTKNIRKYSENIKTNPYPHNVHKTTYPTVYTDSIKQCLAENPEIPHRFLAPHYAIKWCLNTNLENSSCTVKNLNIGSGNNLHKTL